MSINWTVVTTKGLAMARHHESKKEARRHEHSGMERHERGPVKHGHHDPHHHKDPRPHHRGHHQDHDGQYSHSEGSYAGHEMRRSQEMHDAGMIREDHNAIANFPQHVMIKPWPVSGPYLPEVLDDTIRGIDHQMDNDDHQRAKHNKPKLIG